MSSCLDTNRVSEFFEGEEGPSRVAIEEHVAECTRCRELLATHARLFGASEATNASSVVEEPARLGLGLPSPNVLAIAWGEAQVDRVVGRWRIHKVIGLGGCAIVFEAHHRNGSRVAIKLLRPEHRAVSTLMARFMREAYVANTVDHPDVVRVIDDGTTEDGVPYLVMDLLEGETLREHVERAGVLDEKEAKRVALAVLHVLRHAHERGVVHRDIKPDNLFLEPSGRVRVLDFGLARLRAPTDAGAPTETGIGLGTAAYMPPEQAQGESSRVGPSTDLWALAASIVFALAKRPPHVAENAQKTMLLAATRSPPSVVSLVPGLSASFARILDEALSFETARRPADAFAMQRRIEKDGLATSLSRSRGRYARWVSFAVGVMLASGLALFSARDVGEATVRSDPARLVDEPTPNASPVRRSVTRVPKPVSTSRANLVAAAPASSFATVSAPVEVEVDVDATPPRPSTDWNRTRH